MADVTSEPRSRLTEPSSAAGIAALLALLVPMSPTKRRRWSIWA
jgi:hypothetical protein